MLIRIQVDGQRWRYHEVVRMWEMLKPRLMGVGRGGFGYLMEELPAPRITNSRTRFYFTLLGWHTFGRHIAWAARRQGHTVQVRRRRRPDHARVVYADQYQMAVLPDRRRRQEAPHRPWDERNRPRGDGQGRRTLRSHENGLLPAAGGGDD